MNRRLADGSRDALDRKNVLRERTNRLIDGDEEPRRVWERRMRSQSLRELRDSAILDLVIEEDEDKAIMGKQI